MHMWQIDPSARQHLVDVIADALELTTDPGHGAKIEQARDVPGVPDGTLAVTADHPVESAMGSTDRHPGVTLNVLEMFRPDADAPDQLAALLQQTLRWRSYVLVLQETDPDEGRLWFIRHPEPYPDTEVDEPDIDEPDPTD